MRHLFTAVVNAVEALAITLVSLSIIAIGALLMWFGPLALQPEPLTMVRATAAAWGLAHGVPIKVVPDDQFLAAAGFAPGLTFFISLIPLGLTAITIYLSIKLALRISAKFSVGSLVLASATLGFATGAFLIIWISRGFTEVPNASQVVVATCFFALPAWLAHIVKNYDALSESFLTHGRLGEIMRLFPRAIKLSLAMLATAVAVGSLGLAVSILISYPEVMRLSQILQLDMTGAIIIFLLQLVFLPVFIVWAIAWLSGAGFSIGTGSLADPIEPLLGPLPAVPIFGAIPQGLGDWSILSAVIIVLSGVIIGIVFGKLPEFRNPSILVTSSVVIFASLILLLAMVSLAVLSSGSIGPGRMDSLGVSTWPFAWILTAEIGSGVLFGLLLRRIPEYKDLFVKEKTVSADETETVEIKLSATATLSEVGALGEDTVADTNETEDLSRIADPINEKQKPWFHKGNKVEKIAQPLTEEQLLEEYSWESMKLDEENMQTRDGSVD